MESKEFSQKYSELASEMGQYGDISQPKKSGFGSGLRINGKVFAMPSKGRFVVKLPQDKIEKLVSEKKGEPYIYGQKIAKGWMVVLSEKDWKDFALEALEYAQNA